MGLQRTEILGETADFEALWLMLPWFPGREGTIIEDKWPHLSCGRLVAPESCSVLVIDAEPVLRLTAEPHCALVLPRAAAAVRSLSVLFAGSAPSVSLRDVRR